MAQFCGSCGSKLPPEAKWCPACGEKVLAAPEPAPPPQGTPATAPMQGPKEALSGGATEPAAASSDTGRWMIFALLTIVALALVALLVNNLSAVPNDEQYAEPEMVESAPTEESEPDPLADYEDNFLSDSDETLYASAAANVRNFPTPDGSQVIGSLAVGEAVTGRWVTGLTPNTRWLRYVGPEGSSYVWEGALTSEEPFDPEDYRDSFLSAGIVELIVTGPANVRSFPSPDVGRVYVQLQEGDVVRGRWVRGINPETRYLRIETRRGPAYIWEENLL